MSISCTFSASISWIIQLTMFHIFNRIVDIVTNFSLLGPRRIGFYRNRISTGNQNHHSVSGSPEPDFLKIRFRSGRTGFQNLTGFRPDFIIWLDYYRISKFSRIPTGIQKFWQCLSLEGGKEWDVSWFIEVTLTHKRISIRSLGGGRQTMSYWSN